MRPRGRGLGDVIRSEVATRLAPPLCLRNSLGLLLENEPRFHVLPPAHRIVNLILVEKIEKSSLTIHVDLRLFHFDRAQSICVAPTHTCGASLP